MRALDFLPYRYRRRAEIYRHNRTIAEIARTPPIGASGSDPVLLSMLRHSDVLMYLVAIKSVYTQLGRGLIIIIDDGSLTDSDRRVLDHHLGRVRYLKIREIDIASCPQRGFWQRLLAILNLNRDHYLIQVDADIVALGDLSEVAECIRDNRAFTLGGDRLSRLEPVGEASASARRYGDPHVQLAAERLLDQMPGSGSLKYIRGCAAFAGFPRGRGDRSAIVAFSNWMEQRLGPRWHDWGSEQVASNFLVANCPDPLILPWPKYQSYQPPFDISGAHLIHFYGTYRFDNGKYTEQSRRAISMLNDDSPSARNTGDGSTQRW